MKQHLFYTFLSIYAVTAIASILGVTQIIQIKDGYLTPILGVFLLESAGAVIALFKNADFFPEGSNKEPNIKVVSAHYGFNEERFDVKERVKQHIQDGHLNIFINNEILCPGRDPVPNRLKNLDLKYTLYGKRRNVSISEGSHLQLP